MVNIANDHNTLKYKTAFHFAFIPPSDCHTSLFAVFALAHFSAGKRLPVCELIA
jgi:hypothetical protein